MQADKNNQVGKNRQRVKQKFDENAQLRRKDIFAEIQKRVKDNQQGTGGSNKQAQYDSVINEASFS